MPSATPRTPCCSVHFLPLYHRSAYRYSKTYVVAAYGTFFFLIKYNVILNEFTTVTILSTVVISTTYLTIQCNGTKDKV